MDKGNIIIAKQWLQKAENDLLNSSNNLDAPNKPFDTICFHYHQAVEKMLKAFLVAKNKSVPKTHDLLILLEIINTQTPTLEFLRDSLIMLIPYAVEIRYPDDFFMPELEDVQEAKNVAEKVIQWLKDELPALFD